VKITRRQLRRKVRKILMEAFPNYPQLPAGTIRSSGSVGAASDTNISQRQSKGDASQTLMKYALGILGNQNLQGARKLEAYGEASCDMVDDFPATTLPFLGDIRANGYEDITQEEVTDPAIITKWKAFESSLPTTGALKLTNEMSILGVTPGQLLYLCFNQTVKASKDNEKFEYFITLNSSMRTGISSAEVSVSGAGSQARGKDVKLNGGQYYIECKYSKKQTAYQEQLASTPAADELNKYYAFSRALTGPGDNPTTIRIVYVNCSLYQVMLTLNVDAIVDAQIAKASQEDLGRIGNEIMQQSPYLTALLKLKDDDATESEQVEAVTDMYDFIYSELERGLRMAIIKKMERMLSPHLSPEVVEQAFGVSANQLSSASSEANVRLGNITIRNATSFRGGAIQSVEDLKQSGIDDDFTLDDVDVSDVVKESLIYENILKKILYTAKKRR